MKRYAIIVAGGQGLRLGSEIPKQFLILEDRPLLFHTIEKFRGIADEIILVLPHAHIGYWQQLCLDGNFDPVVKIVDGGESRSSSVINGLEAVGGDGVVAIHDAARPLVSRNLINKLFSEAATFGNAVPVIPVRESLRFQKGQDSISIDRAQYMVVQTPQCFKYQSIVNAYKNRGNGDFTDDASVFEQTGASIHLVEGETTNIKITYQEDFLYAEALLKLAKM